MRASNIADVQPSERHAGRVGQPHTEAVLASDLILEHETALVQGL